MPPFNNKPPVNNRPALKPMTQTLNVSRPVLSTGFTPNAPATNGPPTSARTPNRTPVNNNNNSSVGIDTDSSKPKSLRLSSGNASNLITPIIKSILAQYESDDLTIARNRQMLTADLSRQLPLGLWQVTAGATSVRLSITSYDRRTNLVYTYQ